MNKLNFSTEHLIEAAIAVRSAPSDQRHEVAKKFGMSYPTLYRKLKQNNIKIKNNFSV